MILYIFNNYFHDNSGFLKRCRKEIDALSEKFEITVICRGNGGKESEKYQTPYREITILYYNPRFKNNEGFDNYKSSGFYEISRNLDLSFSLSKILIKTLWQNKQKDIKLYSVVSPLTIPFIASFWGKLFNAKSSVLEMHDLEPELAIHSKGLNNNSPILKIEYWLEKIVCKMYKKIIVTSHGQAKRIAERTNVSTNNISILPNTIDTDRQVDMNSVMKMAKQYNILSQNFVVGYISSFTFDYTITGLITFLRQLHSLIHKIPNIKVVIAGDGVNLEKVKKVVYEEKIEKYIVFTGNIANVSDLLETTDVCIVPWERDEMTETILPTKLFEYMQAQKPIVVPNFGEFEYNLKDGENALLYNNTSELGEKIYELYKNKNLREHIASGGYHIYQKQITKDDYREQLNALV